MLETGWVTDDAAARGRGHVLPPLRPSAPDRPADRALRLVRGADGGREHGRGTQGWAYFADELGELHPCCPGCLGEQFGIADRFRLRGAL